MANEEKNVTIYTIAQESGVSPSTVSRVLNGQHVSPRSYERVKPVIDKYQFVPNQLARAMTSNRTQTLGVIMPDITNPYFSALFLEIQKHALQYDYAIILSNTLYGGSSHGIESPFSERQYFQMMIDKKVDGVIVTGGELDKEDISSEYVEGLNRLSTHFPVVAIGQTIENCGCIFINRNLAGGVSALIQHLVALGRRRIGFIGGEERVKTTSARYAAYRSTMASLSLPVDPNIVALTDYYLPDGYRAMDSILRNPHPNPTAVVAINDTVALGAIRAIADHGLRVPEDISVVSCDQFLESEYTVPRLTTIDQQNSYLGRLSMMVLISAINHINEPIQIEHSPRLMIRESCGAQVEGGFSN